MCMVHLDYGPMRTIKKKNNDNGCSFAHYTEMLTREQTCGLTGKDYKFLKRSKCLRKPILGVSSIKWKVSIWIESDVAVFEFEFEFLCFLTLKVLVATIDALGHFETG